MKQLFARVRPSLLRVLGLEPRLAELESRVSVEEFAAVLVRMIERTCAGNLPIYHEQLLAAARDAVAELKRRRS